MNDKVRTLVAQQGNVRVDAVRMVETNPAVVSAVSKMVSGVFNPQYDEKGRRRVQAPDFMHLANTAGDASRGIVDNENLLEMLPDLELALQILVSSILSPKDMMDAKLSYIPPSGLLTATLNSALITAIQTHFTQVYNINRKLPKMLRSMLSIAGSYPTVVIPESSIDYLINKDLVPDMQAYRALTKEIFDDKGGLVPLGILGPSDAELVRTNRVRSIGLESYFQTDLSYDPKATFAMEEYDASPPPGIEMPNRLPSKFKAEALESYLEFTDNPTVLKVPELHRKMSAYNASKKLGLRNKTTIGTEAFMAKDRSKLSEQDIYTLIARQPGSRSRQVNSLTPQHRLSRSTVGAPLIMELPPESVVPVYSPGQPEVHAGYYVVIDDTGNPLSRSSNPGYKDYLGQAFSMPGSAQHRLIQQAQTAFVGMACTSTDYVDYATRIYGDMVESEMISRLKNGLYKGSLTIARNDDIYRLMLSRTLRAQHTKLLFIPAEMMTYFALDYNTNGTGRSIMDDLKTINALRAINTVATVYGSVRNSIGRTLVNIELDPDDPDPVKSREKAINTFAQTRSSMLPIHLNRPLDVISTLQQAGVEFNTTGTEKLPGMNVTVSEVNSQVQKPDQEIDDNLRRMTFMRFGLSPETVDNGFTGEFATSVVANNILLSRRVRQTQEEFVPQVSDHVRKIIRATEGLFGELRDILATAYDEDQLKLEDDIREQLEVKDDEEGTKNAILDYILETFISEMQCELPSPDTTTVENQLAAFNSWKELFDEILDAHITADLFDGERDGKVLAEKMDNLKAIVRNYYIRKWCNDNGVMTELTSMTARDTDGQPMVDVAGEHANFVKELSALFGSTIEATKGLGKNLDKINEAAVALGGDESSDATNSYSGGGGSSSSSDDSSTDDAGGGGGDELGGLGDLGLDDLGGPPGGGF